MGFGNDLPLNGIEAGWIMTWQANTLPAVTRKEKNKFQKKMCFYRYQRPMEAASTRCTKIPERGKPFEMS